MITPFGLLTPTNAWAIIAEHTEPNALSYMKFSKICRASRLVFTSDKLWRDLIPLDVTQGFYGEFTARAKNFTERDRKLVLGLWTDLMNRELTTYPELSSVDGDAILSIPYALWMHLYIAHTKGPTQEAQLQLAALQLWENKTFCIRAVGIRGTLIQYVSDGNDMEIVTSAVYSRTVPHLQLISRPLRSRREVVIPIVSRRDCLGFADSLLWSDFAVMRAALGASWRPIRLASPELCDNEEIAKLATSKSGRSLEYLSARLQSDARIVGQAVADCGLALEHAHASLRDDQALVKIAVNVDGRALRFASSRLQANKSIVETAVSNHGASLEFASPKLQNNQQIVQRAIEQNGCSLKYASESLRDDEDFVSRMILIDEQALQHASAHIQACLRRKRQKVSI